MLRLIISFLMLILPFFFSRIQAENIAELSKRYEQNEYASFLENIQGQYERHLQEGTFDDRLKARKEGNTPFDRLSKKAGYAELYEKWDELLSDLELERNKKLLEACAQESYLPIEQKAKIFASFALTEEQKEALGFLSRLHFKPLKEAKNSSEAQLIEIDTEYEMKKLLVDFALSQGKIDPKTYKIESLVLEMEKMKRMRETALNMEDQELAHIVKQADAIFLLYLNFKEIKEELVLFAKGIEEPSTAMEGKIKWILKEYLYNRNELYKKEFLNKLGLVGITGKDGY